jgi:hypothetical protein
MTNRIKDKQTYRQYIKYLAPTHISPKNNNIEI